MKVLILGIGRTGTSSLLNGIAEQFDVRVSEPFYHRPIFKEFKEFKWPLKVLEDKGNVVIKCLINQTPLHLNVNTDEEMQGFYVDWSKEFDKVILLSRKNIKEHWESWLNLMYRFYQVHKEPWPGDRTKEPKFVKNSHDKWHWETIPQDFIDLQSPIRYKFDQHHESIKVISEQLNIPTIGIGSSANCDGQVLVIDDLIGLSEYKFRFVKKYANLNRIINGAVKKYKSEVLKKKFPKKKHSFVN